MNKLLVCLIAGASFVIAGTCSAGVSPTHDQSQLSQSGAKIAPPKKAEDDAQKKEEEAKKDKEQQQQQQPTGDRR